VTQADFKSALRIVEPSAMREITIEVPKVSWKDIGGLEDVKKQLEESVILPVREPELFKKYGIRPPKGILLYGPPGVGKTLLAKALANESGMNFISVKGPEILSKWVGESEKAIREIFRRARQVAPAIVFFDEIDAIAPSRGYSSKSTETVVSQLLTEMSGIEELNDIVVVAATNRPDILDPALLRPGRFDRQIYVPVPDVDAREKIFRVHTSGMPVDSRINMRRLAELTEGFTGADIEAVCREAAMSAMRTKKKKISMKDFEAVIKETGPSVDESLDEYYKSLMKKAKKAVKQQLNYTG